MSPQARASSSSAPARRHQGLAAAGREAVYREKKGRRCATVVQPGRTDGLVRQAALVAGQVSGAFRTATPCVDDDSRGFIVWTSSPAARC